MPWTTAAKVKEQEMPNNRSIVSKIAHPHDLTSSDIGRASDRRRLLLGLSALLGIAVLPGLTGCGGGGNGNGTAEPSPSSPASQPQPDAPPPAAQVAVAFQAVGTARRIDSRFAGLSYEKDKLAEPLFNESNRTLIQLFRLLGPGVLRIGANAVDRSSWNGEEEGLTPILPAQIDALAAFLQATQWQLVYGINMARNTPENAASEATYVASRLGSSLLAWEIGNEPDLYIRNEYRPSGWDYEDFIGEWRTYRDAISAASPGIPFTGPATSYNLEDFTLPFARDEGSRVPLLTHHYYRASRDDPYSTLELLLEPDRSLLPELTALVETAAEEGMTQGVRIAEFNNFYNGGVANVSNAYGTALWMMDFMFTCALAGCAGVNAHSGGSGPGYTPIAEDEGVVIEARPGYYAMLMFTLAAQGMPMASELEPDININVSAWGVQRDDGGFNAILINKNERRSVEMNLAVDPSRTNFDTLWLRGPSLPASSGQTLDGIVIDKEGNWIPPADPPLTAANGQLNVVLPPASAVLLRSV
jgi:hypothetical protein